MQLVLNILNSFSSKFQNPPSPLDKLHTFSQTWLQLPVQPASALHDLLQKIRGCCSAPRGKVAATSKCHRWKLRSLTSAKPRNWDTDMCCCRQNRALPALLSSLPHQQDEMIEINMQYHLLTEYAYENTYIQPPTYYVETHNEVYVWKKQLKMMLRQLRPHVYKEKYWLPMHNKKVTSIGLNFTLLMLSKPHVREHMGLVLCSSQMSTCWPQVAKTASFQWWSIPVYTVFKVEKRKSLQTKHISMSVFSDCYILHLPCFYSFI